MQHKKDDAETFKQKIDFANEQGLSGLLIWAIDQDTQDLEALKGVVAPKTVAAFAKKADDAAYWGEGTVPDCYVTDCGGSCKPGFVSLTTQPCGNAQIITRHSDSPDSALCCPLNGVPKKEDCSWKGVTPYCNGHCGDSEVLLQMNPWGDGRYCEDGNKAYCCKSPVFRDHKCRWAGLGEKCGTDEVAKAGSPPSSKFGHIG